MRQHNSSFYHFFTFPGNVLVLILRNLILGDDFVFTDKIDALKIFKTYKDSRLKSFKNRNDALKFAKIGLSCIVQDVKCKHTNNF